MLTVPKVDISTKYEVNPTTGLGGVQEQTNRHTDRGASAIIIQIVNILRFRRVVTPRNQKICQYSEFDLHDIYVTNLVAHLYRNYL